MLAALKISLLCLLLSGCVSWQTADNACQRISAVESRLESASREIETLGGISETNQREWAANAAVNQQWSNDDLGDTLAAIKRRAKAQADIAGQISRDRFELANIRATIGG